MGSVITGLLTDADLRSDALVEKALIAKAEVAAPWWSEAPSQ
jgi:hypothetical protein